MQLHASHDFCRSKELSAFAKSEYPSEELRTDDHIRSDGEVVRAVRDDKDIPPQTIQDGADQAVFKPEDHMFLLPGEHTEGFSGVDRHVQCLISLQTVAVLIHDGDFLHFIHPVVLDHGGI